MRLPCLCRSFADFVSPLAAATGRRSVSGAVFQFDHALEVASDQFCVVLQVVVIRAQEPDRGLIGVVQQADIEPFLRLGHVAFHEQLGTVAEAGSWRLARPEYGGPDACTTRTNLSAGARRLYVGWSRSSFANSGTASRSI